MFYPSVPDSAIQKVADVLRGKWIGQGNLIDEFEQKFSSVLHIPHVVGVNNSASAIRLALSIIGVGPGDEVVTTPMTCTLTNMPILEQYAIPVFADIQADTGNINPVSVAAHITKKTKAVVCTHWSGTPCDLKELHEVARAHKLPVIEDASEAVGAQYRGSYIGSISRFTAFSFQAVQILTMGEGGALVARRKSDAARARIQRWFGIDRVSRIPTTEGYYDFNITQVGYGYHLTNIQAVIGIESLRMLSKALNHREKIVSLYRKRLGNVHGLRLLPTYNDRISSNHFFTILVKNRKDFCRKLHELGVEVSIVHERNDKYKVFGGIRKDLFGLNRFSKSYIALPTHLAVRLSDAERIISIIKTGW